MNDLVSIIVPIYNEEKYLGHCLESLLDQSYENLEIICVNDGSTDNSLEILNEYSKRDFRVKLFVQPNQGLSISRNNGLSKANGEYVLFVDCDDWIERDTIKLLYENAQMNDSEVVLYNSVEEYTNRQRKRIYPLNDSNIDWNNFSFDYTFNKKLVLNTYLVVWTKFFRKSFLEEYNLQFRHRLFEDNLFHIQVMIYAKRISYIPKILYHYRKENQPSLQNNIAGTTESFVFFDILSEIEEFLIENDKMDEFRFNFIQYKITELKARFTHIYPENKEALYEKIREEFIKMDLTMRTLNQLPVDIKIFYIEMVCLDFREVSHNHILLENLLNMNEKQFDSNISKLLKNNKEIIIGNYNQLYNQFKENRLSISQLNQSNEYLKDELVKKENKINEYEKIISDKNKQIASLTLFKEDV
ncbi:MAG: hypothetical protein BZ137_09200 [Methanosphaera sp. rholeuAM130]|nr:MAG: hypothetical protein BZ137_09200 [Methanosphaera sp. rholeuAM130]